MGIDVNNYKTKAAELHQLVAYTPDDARQPTLGSSASNKASLTFVAVVTPDALHDGLIAESGGNIGWALSVRADGTIEVASNSGGITLNGGSYSAGETFFVAAVYEKDGTCSLWKNGAKVDSGSPSAGVDATGVDKGAWLGIGTDASGNVEYSFAGTASFLAAYYSAVSDADIADLAVLKDDISAISTEATTQGADIVEDNGPYRFGSGLSSNDDTTQKNSITWTGIITPDTLHDGLIAEAGGGGRGWALSVRADGTLEVASNSGGITLNGGSYTAGETFFVAAVYEQDGTCSLWKNNTKVDSAAAGGTGATGSDPGAWLDVASQASGNVSSAFSGSATHLNGFDYALSDAEVQSMYLFSSSATYDPLTGRRADPIGAGGVIA